MNTYSLMTMCQNCGTTTSHNIPLRKRFYSYFPKIKGMDGTDIQPEAWSKYGDPKDDKNTVFLSCDNCKLPMLMPKVSVVTPAYEDD